jgi:hypothetical protein
MFNDSKNAVVEHVGGTDAEAKKEMIADDASQKRSHADITPNSIDFGGDGPCAGDLGAKLQAQLGVAAMLGVEGAGIVTGDKHINSSSSEAGSASGSSFASASTTASSGFSFADEVNRQGKWTPAKSGKSAGACTPQTGGCCLFCSEQKVSKNKYCKLHKRALESIYTTSKKDDEALESYHMVFGGGENPKTREPYEQDVAKSETVISDFIAENPEGKMSRTGANRTKARGSVQWSRYVHTKGYKQSYEEVNQDPLLDYELFSGKMTSLRRWTGAKCMEKWTELKNNPTIHRDDHNEMGLRLAIPSWLVGGDMFEARRGQFEERTLTTESKNQKNMTDDLKDAFYKDTAKGFDRNPNQGVVQLAKDLKSMESAMHSGSVAFGGEALPAFDVSRAVNRAAGKATKAKGVLRLLTPHGLTDFGSH